MSIPLIAIFAGGALAYLLLAPKEKYPKSVPVPNPLEPDAPIVPTETTLQLTGVPFAWIDYNPPREDTRLQADEPRLGV